MRTLMIALVTWFLVAPAGAGQEELKPFYGTWGGSAVAKNRDSKYFGVGTRASTIIIAPEDQGFVIKWTTSKDGNTAKAKTATLHFVPAARPNVYKAKVNGEPADGKPYIWASVEKKVMTLYILAVNSSGGYDLSIYERKIDGEEMEVRFRRLRDGAPVRIVAGTLKRLK